MLAWIGWTILQLDPCGYSLFGSGCSPKIENFKDFALESVISSNAFQSLSEDQQLQILQQELTRRYTDAYRKLSSEQQHVVEKLIDKHSSNHLRILSTELAIVFIGLSIAFALPWSLIRLGAWVVEGFKHQ